jgi:site-specific recombinase XerD
MARGHTDDNILRGLKYPRTDPVSIRVLTDIEIERVLRAAQTNGNTGFRNYCIVCTFMDTGLRLAELAGLTCEGARLGEGLLDVTGKGRQPRTVPLSPAVRNLLVRYAERHRPATLPRRGEPFFVSERGAALSPNAISLIIKRLGLRADVRRLHPHLFRHSFATGWLRAGGDMETLRWILGHSDYRMVQRYVHLVDEDIRIKHSLVSPMDRFLTQHRVAPPRRRGRTR